MPFGALQVVFIISASYFAKKIRVKSVILAVFVVPVIIGLVVLYVEGTSKNFYARASLGGNYLLAFLYGENPLIVSWMTSNTAGQTKKPVIMCFYNAGSSAGNIVSQSSENPFPFSPFFLCRT